MNVFVLLRCKSIPLRIRSIKITYFAQVASRMFTFVGFLCTGETDFFPETKKKKMLKFYTKKLHL